MTVLFVADGMGVNTVRYAITHATETPPFSYLQQLGLGNILGEEYVQSNHKVQLARAVRQQSRGADSVIGHREMMGIVDPREFPLFPHGMPRQFVEAVSEATGQKGFLFNKMEGGTEAIRLNDGEHRATGNPIWYMSVCDPAAQIAGHEEVVSPDKLAEIVDAVLDQSIVWNRTHDRRVEITRAISRPYVWRDGEVYRTAKRHDAILPLPGKTLIDVLTDEDVGVYGVAKFPELVPGRYSSVWKNVADDDIRSGLVRGYTMDVNVYAFEGALRAIEQAQHDNNPNGAVILVNLVETDKLGHAQRHREAILCYEAISQNMATVRRHLGAGDAILLTADHGIEVRRRIDKPDKTYGFHSAEEVPLIGEEIGRCLKFEGDGHLSDIGLIIAKRHGAVGAYQREVLHQQLQR